jgi:hypothetical protein
MPNETVPTDSVLNFLLGTYGNGVHGSLRPPGLRVRVLHLLIIHLDPIGTLLFPKRNHAN